MCTWHMHLRLDKFRNKKHEADDFRRPAAYSAGQLVRKFSVRRRPMSSSLLCKLLLFGRVSLPKSFVGRKTSVCSRSYATTARAPTRSSDSILADSSSFLDILKDSIIPMNGHISQINVPQFVSSPSRAEIDRRRAQIRKNRLDEAVQRGRFMKPHQ